LPRFGGAFFCVSELLLCAVTVVSALPRRTLSEICSAFRRDGREAFQIVTQIVRKDDRAASALHGTQCARTNCLKEGRPTSTRG